MISTVIFDMDGVISDTQGMTVGVERDLLKRYGIGMSAEEISEYAGVSDPEFFYDIFSRYGKDLDLATVIAEKQRALFEGIKIGVRPILGAKELILQLSQRSVPLGVASASSPMFIDAVLKALSIRQYFTSVTSSEEVSFGKPNPAVFLLAAKKMAVTPEQCVVIEDGRKGMEAARAAGMECVGLVPDPEVGEYPADILVSSLGQLDVDRLLSTR